MKYINNDTIDFDTDLLPECPNCKTKRGLARLPDAILVYPCSKCNVEREGFFLSVKCWKRIRSKELLAKNVFPGRVVDIGTNTY